MSKVTGRDYSQRSGLSILWAGLCGFLGLLFYAVPWKKVFALVAWGAGVYCTSDWTGQYVGEGTTDAYIWAFVFQAILTLGESPLIRRWSLDGKEKRGIGIVNIIAFVFDAGLNTVGTGKVVAGAHEWGWIETTRTLADPSATGPIAPLSGIPALVLAWGFAGVLCALPEALWFDEL